MPYQHDDVADDVLASTEFARHAAASAFFWATTMIVGECTEIRFRDAQPVAYKPLTVMSMTVKPSTTRSKKPIEVVMQAKVAGEPPWTFTLVPPSELIIELAGSSQEERYGIALISVSEALAEGARAWAANLPPGRRGDFLILADTIEKISR